jgi:hypothetical protein
MKKEIKVITGEIVAVILTDFGKGKFPKLTGREIGLITEVDQEKTKTIKLTIVFFKKVKKEKEEEIEKLVYLISFPSDKRVFKLVVPKDNEITYFKEIRKQSGL